MLHVSMLLRSKIIYFIKSGFPSSLPLCSSPLVHAKILAMGLVLVGLPCNATTQLKLVVEHLLFLIAAFYSGLLASLWI